MRGLSFMARAVFATATALTYQYQRADIEVALIKSSLGLSDEAWASALTELSAAGILLDSAVEGGADTVQTSTCFDLLSIAIGVGGRPSKRQWDELRSAVLESEGAACAYCGATDKPLAIDHIRPVSRRGSNHPYNLAPACKSCNSEKGTRTWQQWWRDIGRLRA